MNICAILLFVGTVLFVGTLEESAKTKRDIRYPWYRFMDCYETVNGVFCEPSKEIITPNTDPYQQQQIGNVHNRQSQTGSIRTPDDSVSTNEPVDRNRDTLEPCTDAQFTCTSRHQCVEKRVKCDRYVNCVDGTDEENCTCISKLNREKICDNYYDCPDGEDEIGCGGCDSNSNSCYSNVENECYTKDQKCNLMGDCSNEEDERDCYLLSPFKEFDNFVKSTEGFLFLNFKTLWYPVCFYRASSLAQLVCEKELGVQLSPESINTSLEETSWNGKYVDVRGYLHIKVVDRCPKNDMEPANQLLYVQCPNVCGTVSTSIYNDAPKIRIAGGKKASWESHPWMASLYLNGTFKCGGSIISKRWIITAAHCVLHHKHKQAHRFDHLQVRVGFIRQRSFSPHEQNIRVYRIVIHPDYNSSTLINDIALLELQDSLVFNRYVKPICLPSKNLIGNGTDPNWLWKPDANTTCAAVQALVAVKVNNSHHVHKSKQSFRGVNLCLTSRGPNPVDDLTEVTLQVVSNCLTNNARAVCTGQPISVSDTCIGDCGGPLECRSDTNLSEIYLAGITSGGYDPIKNKPEDVFCGEPNSLGTFTRTVFYLEWIEKSIFYEEEDDIYPVASCPGITCTTSRRCVPKTDGIVDCLNGEDEIKKEFGKNLNN